MTGKINGYDITKYATDPTHEQRIQAMVNTITGQLDVFVGNYIRKRAPDAPIDGVMVVDAAQKYGVDLCLLLALMQNDSMFGTKGKGARTKNPGNVGNMDDGSTREYETWEAGVEAVAKWLDKHRV